MSATPIVRVGKVGSPYRAPCAGWKTPPAIFSGSPWNHYRVADSSIEKYQNTTTVPNPDCGNNYGQTGQSPCSNPPPASVVPFAQGVDDGIDYPTARLVNTYAPYSPAQYVNLAQCRKIGFKNVFARKFWQGRFGFTDDETCVGCPPTAMTSPSQTKYRTLTWTASYELQNGDPSDPDTVTTVQTASGSMTVNRYSGQTTGTFSEEITYSETNLPLSDGMTASPLSDLLSIGYCGGQWTSAGTYFDTAAVMNGTAGGTWTIDTNSHSNTELNIAYHGVDTFFNHITSSCTLTLSDPYTADELNADVNGLLAQWDMSDDAQYQWRTDTTCNLGPFVTYDEEPEYPTIFLEDMANSPDSFTGGTDSYTDPTTGYTTTWNWTDSGGGEGPGSITITGNVPDATGGSTTGNIWGAPNPAGYDPFWDSKHKNYVDGTLSSYGAYAPSYCAYATQWLDDDEAMAVYPCAYAHGDGDQSLTKCKWAEVIMMTAPSYNFARPMGARDQQLRDQATVNCGTSPCSSPWPNQYGDLLFPSAPAADPSDQWYDNQAKGDWCLITWNWNLRTTPGVPTSIGVSQECSDFETCCPAVVYITPQDGSQPVGETNGTNNSQSFAHPNLGMDYCYGSLWQSIPKQWMTDPLWQVPAKPCDRLDDGCDMLCQWTEDDGSGQPDTGGSPCYYFYPQRPYVECRASVPSGAPALPSGFLLNWNAADIGTTPPQTPLVSGNTVWLPVWFWELNREETIAVSGRFACEYANPLAICADDSDDSPT